MASGKVVYLLKHHCTHTLTNTYHRQLKEKSLICLFSAFAFVRMNILTVFNVLFWFE